QIIGDLSSATQTRSMTRVAKDQGGLSKIKNDDFHTCMFACFLSQEEPKREHQALKDPSWIEAMHEELLQFKMQKVWVLADLPNGKRAIGYASFMGFMMYQMDVKSAFLYGTIEEEVYVCQPTGFEDPDYLDKVYKVVKALYGLHQAPKAWYETLANYLLKNGFQRVKIDQTLSKGKKTSFMSSMGELTFFLGLQVKQKQDGIFICQDKYVAEILRKFSLIDEKSVSTPIDTEKPLLKDSDGEDVDVHTYRSMIGSLMYLTSLRPDIMFAVCACARFQAYSDSDYAGASLDMKFTTGGCQFLGCRLISWQCKKQTVVATSSTKAEYVAAASCCAQVLWIQNQLLDYGLNVTAVSSKFLLFDTPLFEGMIVAQQVDDIADESAASVAVDDVPAAGRIIANMDADEDVTLKDVADIAKEVAVDAEIEKSADDDEVELVELQEVVEVVTTAKLMTEVVTAASATITAATTPILAATIIATPSAARRRNGVVIRDPEETATPSIIIHSEAKSKDNGKGILVEEPKPLKKQAQIEQDEAYARELEAELNKTINWDDVIDQVQRKEKEDNVVMRNMAGFKMDYFKGMEYDDIRLIFEKYFNSNVAFLEKTKEQMEEEDNKALKRANESQAEKASKKQKLDENVTELKRHLQIVLNDEDDIYTEATPLACKVPVVDYEIYTENNKPDYKIIRADGSPQLFLSF
nr:hypothetical protein [Tanacetum cinerariifolium]